MSKLTVKINHSEAKVLLYIMSFIIVVCLGLLLEIIDWICYLINS